MEDCDEYFLEFREQMEEYYPYSEKNIENESNRNEEKKNINTNVNTNININNNNNIPIVINNSNPNFNNNYFNNISNTIINHGSNKNDNENIDFYNNNNYNIHFNNEKPNASYNFEEYQIYSQNYFEQNDNKKTSNSSNLNSNNGKLIYTTNEFVTAVFKEIFNTTEINLENKNDMQFLKKKKRRRTKAEIEKEKTFISEKEKKKVGRKKKFGNEKSNKLNCHSKIADDNIMKKINSYFLESIRNWLNNSFIDDDGFFDNLEERKKLKKQLFLKIDPKIIATNLKRKSVINTMDIKFKDIFSNNISKKYSKNDVNKNRELIDEIYIDQKQFFIIQILELKFIEAFNYFNCQKKMEDLKKVLIDKKIDIIMITTFLENLNKIDKFLKEIYNNQIKNGINRGEIKDYLERISLLCLNYKVWFESKFNRSENKNKKNSEKDN